MSTATDSQTSSQPVSQRPKIVLDCDPGLDDALAILTAAHFGELIGITTVNGNVGIEHTTHNALITAQIAGLSAEVHRGAARPLIAPTMDAARVHGATGLGDVALPELRRSVASDDAVTYLCDIARSVEDLHLVAVGPLTNVALALRRDPDLHSHLASLTIMGGAAHGGNVTPVAEFNIWADPEAAAIVFREAAPLTMVGLDVTHKVLLGGDEASRMRAATTPVADFAADLLDYAYARCREYGLEAAPMHDATAVIAVTHPDLFQSSSHPVMVEIHGEHTRGMTVTDTRPLSNFVPDSSVPMHQVVWDADADAVIDLTVQACTVPGSGMTTSSV